MLAGTALPTTGMAVGDLFYQITDKVLYVRGSSTWDKVGSKKTDLWAIGSIQQSILTETQFQSLMGNADWVPMDGRSIAGSALAALTGKNTVDDYRGGFLRVAGQNSNNKANWNGGTAGTWRDDTTRAPRNTPFTTGSAGAHTHNYTYQWPLQHAPYGNNTRVCWEGSLDHRSTTTSAGDHTHTITGGDAETSPSHFSVNTFIKIN
jgi:hypothetical protein